MAVYRVPPQIMGIMPSNVRGDDMEKASNVFVRSELMPLQAKIMEINQLIVENIIKFNTYSFS